MKNKTVATRDRDIRALLSNTAVYSNNDVYRIIKKKHPEMTCWQSASFIRRNMEKITPGIYALKPMPNKEQQRAIKKSLDAVAVIDNLAPISITSSFGDPIIESRPNISCETAIGKVIKKIRFAEKYNIPYEGLIELIKELEL